MLIQDITEDKLNLFIDEQLDTDEMDEIRQFMLDDKDLHERVCQLKAVRELVGYAYSAVPSSKYENTSPQYFSSFLSKSITASLTLILGIIVGWSTYEYSPIANNIISAENTFQYVANHVTVDRGARRIILHIDSSDLQVVSAALDEADSLLASYRKTNTPIQLDVVTNKQAINILRPGVSPYIKRIKKLIDDDSVSIYACERSITKAQKREGVEIVLVPGVKTDKTAREIIPQRLEKGWVYIKA